MTMSGRAARERSIRNAGPDLCLVSDSHLSSSLDEASSNWSSVVSHVERVKPRLVLHAGDVSRDGAGTDNDLRYSYAKLAELSTPWFAVPGNHDVREAVDGPVFTPWRQYIGPEYWTVELNGWLITGLPYQALEFKAVHSPQALSSTFAAIEESIRGRPAILILHKPVARNPHEGGTTYLSAPVSKGLLRLTERSSPLVIVNGHTHAFRLFDDNGVRELWLPSTWASLARNSANPPATRVCGVVDAWLLEEGSISMDLVAPRGMCQYHIGLNLSDPY